MFLAVSGRNSGALQTFAAWMTWILLRMDGIGQRFGLLLLVEWMVHQCGLHNGHPHEQFILSEGDPVIPTLAHYSDIVSDIPSGSIHGIYWHILTFYLAI